VLAGTAPADYTVGLDRRGTVWIDDLALEPVEADVPTTAGTGWLSTSASPSNLNFER